MATPVAEVVKVNWKQLCPWLALFRALGLSLHVRQVFVGTVAATLMTLISMGVAGPSVVDQPSLTNTELDLSVCRPLLDVARPIMGPHTPSLVGAGHPGWLDLVKLLVELVFAFVIVGFAGGILVRRAAFEFCREETLSLKDAGQYVLSRWLDYLSAPALPMGGVLSLMAGLMLLGGLVRIIPGLSYVVAALWGLVVIVGLGTGLLLVLTLAAWPMMIAAVSVSGADGFDALSRGFGFVIDRWRYYGWCVVVMCAYGGLCLMIGLVIKFVGEQVLATYMIRRSTALELPQLLSAGTWSVVLTIIYRGLSYSFFWSSITIIYLVLRKSVDNAELTDVHFEGGPSESDDLQALINPQLGPGPTLLPIIDPPRN